ncbi:AAEL013754-PA [Aedes aegypti]|nr:AAEL013754-PA [Aedes aegypti]
MRAREGDSEGVVVRKMRLNCWLRWFAVGIVTLQLLVASVGGIYVVEKGGRKSFVKLSPAQWTEPDPDGMWSSLLEDYTLG